MKSGWQLDTSSHRAHVATSKLESRIIKNNKFRLSRFCLRPSQNLTSNTLIYESLDLPNRLSAMKELLFVNALKTLVRWQRQDQESWLLSFWNVGMHRWPSNERQYLHRCIRRWPRSVPPGLRFNRSLQLIPALFPFTVGLLFELIPEVSWTKTLESEESISLFEWTFSSRRQHFASLILVWIKWTSIRCLCSSLLELVSSIVLPVLSYGIVSCYFVPYEGNSNISPLQYDYLSGSGTSL